MTTIRSLLTPNQIAELSFGKRNSKENSNMTAVAPETYSRKTFDVEGIQVTAENIDAVASWCNGKVLAHKATEEKPSQEYISVPVKRALNDRQTQAHIGDWVLKARTGFKVYTDKAMKGCFERKRQPSAPTHVEN